MNKILINYLLLMSASIVSVMSQQNEYESFIEKGNNSFEENSVLSEQNYRKAISVSPEFIKGQYNFSNNLYDMELPLEFGVEITYVSSTIINPTWTSVSITVK